MKKTITTVLVLFLIQSTVFSNGLSLNSIGTRALGMGGAFVGLANDGSAIYWNPAGLIGQKSAVNIGATAIMPFATYGDIDAESQVHLAPNLFVNYNMGDLALGLGVFVPAGLGVSWNSEDFGVPGGSIDILSQIGVIDIAPAVAYKVSDKFSVGLTVNIYYAMFEMKQPTPVADFSPLGGPVLFPQQFEEDSDGLGFGATIGIKYNASEKLSLGATVRLATKVSMEGTAKNALFPKLPAIAPIPGVFPGSAPGPAESDFSRDVTWPLWIAGGVAYKATDKLTLVLDAQYSQWSELDELVAEYDDPYWAVAMVSAGNDKFELKWEDAVQIRAGAEYMVNDNLDLRFGYYYDPAPAPDETLNILFPSSTNHVATAGLSYMFGKVSVEAGLEYLFGAEREIKVEDNSEWPGTHQMDIFAFSIAIGYAL